MALLKINYSKKEWLGISLPFYHPSFEIKCNGKTIRRGFYARPDFLWPISFVIPILGELRKETNKSKSFWSVKDRHVHSKIISRDKNKIKKVISLINSKKYNWNIYSMFFRNCFHWRNFILKEAGINLPNDSWFSY